MISIEQALLLDRGARLDRSAQRQKQHDVDGEKTSIPFAPRPKVIVLAHGPAMATGAFVE